MSFWAGNRRPDLATLTEVCSGLGQTESADVYTLHLNSISNVTPVCMALVSTVKSLQT